jgi:hypothetical protein
MRRTRDATAKQGRPAGRRPADASIRRHGIYGPHPAESLPRTRALRRAPRRIHPVSPWMCRTGDATTEQLRPAETSPARSSGSRTRASQAQRAESVIPPAGLRPATRTGTAHAAQLNATPGVADERSPVKVGSDASWPNLVSDLLRVGLVGSGGGRQLGRSRRLANEALERPGRTSAAAGTTWAAATGDDGRSSPTRRPSPGTRAGCR